MSKLEITLKKSPIGSKPGAREALRSLGLKKIGQTVTHEDNPATRGQLRVVVHMVEVKEVE